MRVLITGGAGFIGSHIAHALCQKGANVVILDNFSTGSEKNLSWATRSGGIDVVRGNITDSALVKQLVADRDWVFHLAAIASVQSSIEDPFRTNAENLSASLSLLEAARDAKVKRYIFASSSAIYGNSDRPIKSESDGPLPESPYALQKYTAEKYGQMFHRFFGLPTVSLRYFNVFGPRQGSESPYSGVIAKFCAAFLAGTRPTIFGDGTQSRDFIYIDNVVSANLLVAEAAEEKVAGQVFNVGAGTSVNLLNLVSELNRLTGAELSPIFEPARPGDIRDSRAAIHLARLVLRYQVLTTFEAGLEKTLDFYRAARS
jgi:nucleoside-diphosphate-sugar epimerase